MKLGLGTVQLGLDYGISNRDGRTPRAEARRILAKAAGAGVRVLDTAPAYGEAESVLGELAPEASPFEVVTKTPVGARGARRVEARVGLLASLRRLRRSRVRGLLVHDCEDLLGPHGEELFDELRALKDEGLVERLGASVYHPEQAEALLARFPLELLQLPVSVLDQRALRSGLLERLAARGVEVHARSVFLQGLLLMDPADLPHGLERARGALRAFRARARELGRSPLETALGFVEGLAGVDVVLCGVERPAQLDQLLAALGRGPARSEVSDLAIEALDILDPSRWLDPR